MDHAKLTDKEKTHFSTAKLQLSTAPKLTSSYEFHLRQPTVSLQYNNPFSKNIGLASAVQLSFRTDSKPLRRRFADNPGFDTSRRKFLQNHFRQSFESLPGVQRFANLWCAFCVTFCRAQKVTTRSLCREYRGLQNLESAHRSRSFAPQQLKPF